MSDTFQAIEGRIKELEAQLSVSPAYRELVILREARNKLLDLNTTSAGRSPRQQGLHRGQRKRITILKGVSKALKAKGHPLRTKELVGILPQYGTSVGGAKPAQNLTSILSKRGEFESIRWRNGPAWWFKGRNLPDETILESGEMPPEKAAGRPDSDEPAAGSTTDGGTHATA